MDEEPAHEGGFVKERFQDDFDEEESAEESATLSIRSRQRILGANFDDLYGVLTQTDKA